MMIQSLLVLLVFGLQFNPAFADPSIGKMVELKGQAWAKSDGQPEHELKVNAPLFRGEHLRTSKGGFVKIILGGQIAILAKENSEMTLDGPKNWSVSLDHGALLSSVKNEKHPHGFFRIKTRTSTMGVRGTVFFVKADPGKPILFCPCHGEIEVTALDSKSEVKFKSEHHDNPKLISGGTLAMKERMVDIPKDYDIDHSDGEIADLQALLKN